MHRSEVYPDVSNLGATRYEKFQKTKKQLRSLCVGKMTVDELDAVRKFLEMDVEAWRLNAGDVLKSEISSMKKIIKKCSS